MMWWLISDDDAKKIKEALETAQELEEKSCREGVCWCDMDGGPRCGVYYAGAIHTLASGLHQTDVVPSDFDLVPDVEARS